ncbi:MAG: M48 family metallopeptidase [Prevotellaceae bacterium]|jgi:predicted metal-dependent hydrolase|nr:M48 family metallopeptidase [Prevotellaceae bacterium]
MDAKKIVTIEGIGVVEYRKSTKAKYLRISVHRERGVVVSVPERLSFDEAESFVTSRIEWIEKSLQKLDSSKPEKTVYDGKNEFSTKFRTMNLIPDSRKNMHLKISETHFDIYYPHDADVENEEIQLIIRRFIEHVWKVEAHEYLPKRLMQLANACNLGYRDLTVKNTRSFWGKCDGNNSIVLSLHLMHLPDRLIDYVIIHELCHTVHKNHQKEFWMLLDRLTSGKAKILAKEMKNYSTRIY